MMLLYIVGGVWIGGITLFMLALGAAASKPTPVPDTFEASLDPESAEVTPTPMPISTGSLPISPVKPALAGMAH